MIYLTPIAQLSRHLNNNIKKSLKANYPIHNTKDIVNCNINTLKQQLEDNFQPNMNWDNINDWRIDYIIPICHAKNKDEVILLHHYSNLIPVWNYIPKSKTITNRALMHPLYKTLTDYKLIQYLN